jgi:formylglycine-generating enzyme required for sulfatase activity
MLATLAIALQLLAAGAGLAQGVGDEAAANRLMVEAVEAWRRAEALRADDLVTVQERLKALRAVDANLKRIVEQHKSSSLAVKLVLGEKLGPLSLDETARAIAASRQQEEEALLKALANAIDRNVAALGPTGSAPAAPAASPARAAPAAPAAPVAAAPSPGVAPPAAPPRPAPAPAAPPQPAARQHDATEITFWESVRASRNPDDLEAYLRRYPAGAFVDLARNRLQELKRAATAAPVPAPPAVQPPRPPAPGSLFRDCPECPEMVVVPAGRFVMGAAQGEEEAEGLEEKMRGRATPRRNVQIAQPFALGRLEVTRGQFAAFARETGHDGGKSCWTIEDGKWESRDGRNWRAPGFAQDDTHPVSCVSWDDAQAYVAWLSRRTRQAYRLPSDAEWEYAARAGTTSRRPWGNAADTGCVHANLADQSARRRLDIDLAVACDDGHAHTAPGGSLRANAFGLHDVIGNVFEWVVDCWNDDLAGIPADGTARMTGDCAMRPLRGGSFYVKPVFARTAHRLKAARAVREVDNGFRVARPL